MVGDAIDRLNQLARDSGQPRLPAKALGKLRHWLFPSQQSFNAELADTLTQVVSGRAPYEPDKRVAWLRAKLKPLAQERGPRRGMFGRLGTRLLARQRQWNLEMVKALELLFSRPDGEGPDAGSLAPLAGLADPAPAASGPVRRLLRRQQAINYLALNVLRSLNHQGSADESPIFRYRGYEVPENLVLLTGGGPETWEEIGLGHLRTYSDYAPIESHHHVLEIGCGVGRDAMHLAEQLDGQGSYVGFDVIRPSIEWCTENITARHPNCRFHHVDVYSQIHNPGGTLKAAEIDFPAADGSIDRVIAQSVFTHMFEQDIIVYLKECRRVLKPDGLAVVTVFILDPPTLRRLRKGEGIGLAFRHTMGDGCWIEDPHHPEGAVGYSERALARMLDRAGMEMAQPPHLGKWSGREAKDGQDILVLRTSAARPGGERPARGPTRIPGSRGEA